MTEQTFKSIEKIADEQANWIKHEFDRIGRYFPNVLGVIDGCHFPIHEEDKD